MKPAFDIPKFAFPGYGKPPNRRSAKFATDVLPAKATEWPSTQGFAVPVSNFKGGYEYLHLARFRSSRIRIFPEFRNFSDDQAAVRFQISCGRNGLDPA